MWTLWKEKKNALADQKVWSEALKIKMPSQDQPTDEKHGLAGQIHAAIGIFQALLIMLDERPFDGLTEGELQGMRESDGGTIAKLSAHLNSINAKLVLLKEGG